MRLVLTSKDRHGRARISVNVVYIGVVRLSHSLISVEDEPGI